MFQLLVYLLNNPYGSVFGKTDSLTVDCNIVCGKGVLFLCGVVSVG